jgi:hypothetical protein
MYAVSNKSLLLPHFKATCVELQGIRFETATFSLRPVENCGRLKEINFKMANVFSQSPTRGLLKCFLSVTNKGAAKMFSLCRQQGGCLNVFSLSPTRGLLKCFLSVTNKGTA